MSYNTKWRFSGGISMKTRQEHRSSDKEAENYLQGGYSYMLA